MKYRPVRKLHYHAILKLAFCKVHLRNGNAISLNPANVKLELSNNVLSKEGLPTYQMGIRAAAVIAAAKTRLTNHVRDNGSSSEDFHPRCLLGSKARAMSEGSHLTHLMVLVVLAIPVLSHPVNEAQKQTYQRSLEEFVFVRRCWKRSSSSNAFVGVWSNVFVADNMALNFSSSYPK